MSLTEATEIIWAENLQCGGGEQNRERQGEWIDLDEKTEKIGQVRTFQEHRDTDDEMLLAVMTTGGIHLTLVWFMASFLPSHLPVQAVTAQELCTCQLQASPCHC